MSLLFKCEAPGICETTKAATSRPRSKISMLFMVIERFKNHNAAEVYRRFRERGRMMPESMKYIDSWVDAKYERCFQLMECDDAQLFEEWAAHWNDLVEFEVVPVMTSKEAGDRIAPQLE